jgi:transcriptional regulator with XRE-family HTH domain
MSETIQQKVGKRIVEIRTEKNISQQELASKCNFEKSNMSRLEKGNVNATLSTLEKVCDALQIEYIELFKFQ